MFDLFGLDTTGTTASAVTVSDPSAHPVTDRPFGFAASYNPCGNDTQQSDDLVRAFSSPFPVNVIAEILGIPKEMHDRLRMWNATTSVTGAAEPGDAHPMNMMQDLQTPSPR